MNPLKVIAAWGAFALFHSATVSEPYERWARGVLGEARFRAYHRLLFTLTSAAVIAHFYLGTFFEERRMIRKFGRNTASISGACRVSSRSRGPRNTHDRGDIPAMGGHS